MKKVYKLRELDCANCAQKMEDAIRKLPGVEEVSVNFMAQKLTLSAEESQLDGILREAAKIIKRIEPDCEIVIK